MNIQAKAYIFEDWFLAFHQSGILVTPYPFALFHESDSVPKRHVTGFPKNVANYAVPAKAEASRSFCFVPHFDLKFTDVCCPSLNNNTVVSKISWPERKLNKTMCWKSLRKT